MKARLKDNYDAIADTYNAEFTNPDDPVRFHYLDLLLSRVGKDTDKNVMVLELGCGTGVPATKRILDIEKPVVHVTSNELSTYQLDIARKNLSGYQDRLTLVESDMMALSFPDQSFHAVTGFYSIIHLPREEQTQLIEKIVKWLKHGGLLLANFAVDESEVVVEENWLAEDKMDALEQLGRSRQRQSA